MKLAHQNKIMKYQHFCCILQKKRLILYTTSPPPRSKTVISVVAFPTFIAPNRFFFALWEILEQITKILYKTTDRIVL